MDDDITVFIKTAKDKLGFIFHFRDYGSERNVGPYAKISFKGGRRGDVEPVREIAVRIVGSKRVKDVYYKPRAPGLGYGRIVAKIRMR